MSSFHLSGAVPVAAKCYANRAIDKELFEKATQGSWSLVLGPRQQGKTSAFLRLVQALRQQGVRCVLVDLQARPTEEPYQAFLRWFAQQVRGSIVTDAVQVGAQPTGPEELQLSSWLRWAIGEGSDNVVIAIDEASAIRSTPTRHSFFGQLRAIANKRADQVEGAFFQRLTFFFAGTFKPESLVPDENSPFNVCDRLDAADLLKEDVLALSKMLGSGDPLAIAEAIFAETLGQPFLVQLILDRVEESPQGSELAAVAAAIGDLKQGVQDRGHVNDLFRRVLADSRLVNLVAKLCADGSLQLDAANADIAFLRVVGLVRRDGMLLRFRNPIYEHVARHSPHFTVQPQTQAGLAMFALPEPAFGFVTDPSMKEYIFTSQQAACRCLNTGSYRLALGGFGCALECLLIHLCQRLPGAVLAKAVGDAKAAQGGINWTKFENAGDPLSWRLVNLVKIAKQVPGINKPLEVSDALRDWRNLLHPGVALGQGFRKEADLSPEAIQAYGMFAAIHRDLSSILK